MSQALADAPNPGAVADGEVAEVAGRSLRRIVWDRLKRDRTAMVCLWILIALYIIAILAPVICSVLGIDPYTADSAAVSDSGGRPIGPWAGASREHPLGVEWGTGRDILAQLLFGLRISLLIATSATTLTVILGTVLGIVAGYLGGATDAVIGRIIDVIIAFPFLLLILALSGVLTERLTSLGVPEGNPSRILYLILVLSIFGWTYLARIVRGQVLSLREKEFVESSIAMGSGTSRILFREMLPNLWAPILVYVTNTLPLYLGIEAGLSFLGVGVIPPDTTFGTMLGNSVSYFRTEPLYLFIPGTVLVILVVTFNLLGDAVRDALDPRAGRV